MFTQSFQPTIHQNPDPSGLYDPAQEHDACGAAWVADLNGAPTHEVVSAALTALVNLEHRGAVGAEENTGDGAGILLQVPHTFFAAVVDFPLPDAGAYAAGIVFLPQEHHEAARDAVGQIVEQEGLEVLGWREVPVNPAMIGPAALAAMPQLWQLFTAAPGGTLRGIELDRKTFRVRKRMERELGLYAASLSARTITYKGMLTTFQLQPFYPELSDERVTSQLALVHSRFSTNTFPSWPLAQPLRMLAHNGEINTVRGNRNWMAARQSTLSSDLIGEFAPLLPICSAESSDSASFDEVLELLHLAGRSLPHAVMMMIPEAWENNADMDPQRRAFYEYHSTLMEPWDGPANLSFTDGTLIGTVLDRNGLRPGRYWITDQGLVVLASESGVLDIAPENVVTRGRVEPGKMFLVDTAAGRIVSDDEVKTELASEQPYAQWVKEHAISLEQLPQREHITHTTSSVQRRQAAFGYTEEELKILLTPMANAGAEPLGAMGSDTPLAVLSARPRLLFDYFVQMFAQVTNPPLDSIREEMVTCISASIGPEPNLLAADPTHARKLIIGYPVLDNDALAKITRIHRDPELAGTLSASTVRGLFPANSGGAGLAAALERIFAEVDELVSQGVSYIVLSDRDADADHAAIPSLLLTSAVHQHLLARHTRTRVSLVVEAGDVREVHHVALLLGYGAGAVNPYLAMETVEDLARRGYLSVDPEQAVSNLLKALGKGVLKVMSKMGISTLASYRGAQVFEALGLSGEFVNQYFTGTASRLDGVGIETVAAEVSQRHTRAYPRGHNPQPHHRLETGGEYQWRRDGELHLFDPETVFRLQHSTRERKFDVFRRYSERINDQSSRLMTLRGLLGFAPGEREPIPLDEVEPVSEIVKRFSTGAMSYGSISAEAHETLAEAMNILGGKSNTGEGGEDPQRLYDPARRSAIKQIASGRFGVTSEYLVNADDLQIKMAQGAKPGEGGQLPGHKVSPWIAGTRHATPGVGLISPPPHHDIYSIEDLAQLIHDLKNANPQARVHVKLVSQAGVGTVATGVAKAHADVVLISGHDGGTGASPLTSLKHAGGPWELGLAETQQTLIRNGLRDRVVVQVDGQLKTGRDVVVAALLGAEEYGFATSALVVSGCIMMRVCHLDTCPVGVATQNPELRARFSGKAEYIVTFFEYIAQEVRELLAGLGFRSLEEAVGHSELLDRRAVIEHWKAQSLDLEPILAPAVPFHPHEEVVRRQTRLQDHGLSRALDNELISLARPALEKGVQVRAELPVRNVNRSVGTMLGYEVTRRYRGAGLPTGTIDFTFTGTAGQSFGAFLPAGITLRISGDANDYVGKGLSGGRIIVAPPENETPRSGGQVIAGNVIGYGATSGEIFLRGTVGERFAVRNSGATLVVEGIGDHGFEYMTGGTVLVLGPTGRNLAAGMSGGVGYVLDLDQDKLNVAARRAEELEISALNADDLFRVRELLARHSQETDSTQARELAALSDTELAGRISRIMPVQYARMTAALAAAAAQQIDLAAPGEWEKLLEVSHG